MVVFDTSFLLHLIDPDLPPPIDPNSEQPVENSHQRAKYLVNELNDSHTKIIIPTPALGELLILAGNAGRKYLEAFTRSSVFQVEPFDVRAAVELAIMTARDIRNGDKKAGSTASAAKVKFDRQIVAITKVSGGSQIYTNDTNLKKFANSQDIETLDRFRGWMNRDLL